MLGESENIVSNVKEEFGLDEFRCSLCNLKFEDQSTFDSHLCGNAEDKITACKCENCKNSFSYEFLFHEHNMWFHDKKLLPLKKVTYTKNRCHASVDIAEKYIKIGENDEHVKNGYNYSERNLFDKTLGSDTQFKAESRSNITGTSLARTIHGSRVHPANKFMQHSCNLVKAHLHETAPKSSGSIIPDSRNKEFSNAPPDSCPLVLKVMMTRPFIILCKRIENDMLESKETISKSSGDMLESKETISKSSGDMLKSKETISKSSGDMLESKETISKSSGDMLESKETISKSSGDIMMLESKETISKSSGDIMLDSDCKKVSTEIICEGERTLKSEEINLKKFKCVTCDKIFLSKKNFKKHSSVRCLLKPFPCKYCGISFKRRQHLLIHARSHTGEQPYSCPNCNKSYVHRKSLTTHLQTHTGKTLTCDVCGKMFRGKTFLQQHMRYHDQNKIFKCSVCNEKFIYISSLNEHSRIHRNERLFLCDTCGAKFSRKAHLIIHTRSHTRQRIFSCSVCDSTYAHKKDLNNHVLSHKAGPKLMCYLCCGSFSTKAYLRIHMLLHIGKKSYGCEVCKKMFTHVAALKRHKNTHDIEEFLMLA